MDIVGQYPHTSRRVPKRPPPPSTSLSACLTPSHHAPTMRPSLPPFPHPHPHQVERTLTDRRPPPDPGRQDLTALAYRGLRRLPYPRLANRGRARVRRATVRFISAQPLDSSPSSPTHALPTGLSHTTQGYKPSPRDLP